MCWFLFAFLCLILLLSTIRTRPCSANGDGEAFDNDCARAWGLPCPVGFSGTANIDDTHVSDVTCVPDLYLGPVCVQWLSRGAPSIFCVLQCSEPEVAFPSLEDKKSFAFRCNTAWPCSVQCEKTGLASSLCPEGWAHIGVHAYVRVAFCPGCYIRTRCLCGPTTL